MESTKRIRIEPRHYLERRSLTAKQSRLPEHFKPVNAVIFDNGGHSIKIGYNHSDEPESLPNQIMKAKSERKRAFISNQIEDCRDLSGLYYIMPCEKGYITKFDVQKSIWDYVFNKYSLEDYDVVMTQPIYNFRMIQEYTDEIFFEEYDVKNLHRATGTDYSYHKYISDFKVKDVPSIVVDSGFSFTHVVPYINGQKYAEGIIRMNVGGKLLTNYLKDILSYRQLHVMEETYVINQLKEDICFMSQDFNKDMHRAKTTLDIVKNYVLPDFHNIRRGYVQEKSSDELAENCQILRLNNERITVPEILIRPSIIPGFNSAGLGQCIAQAINKCPEQYRKALSNNIVLTGGNCLFPGFRERVEKETRIFLPCENGLQIFQPPNSLLYPWQGAKLMSNANRFKSKMVSKQEYDENGSNYTYEKFNQYCKLEEEPANGANGPEAPSFSYLNYWKQDDLKTLNGDDENKDSSVQFKLEGDNLEEYDGKLVTIEFEYEETEKVSIESEDENGKIQILNNLQPKTRSILQPTPNTRTIILANNSQNGSNLSGANPKVYRASKQRFIHETRYLSFTTDKLGTLKASTSANGKINNSVMLQHSTFVPASSLTFQIIPLKPEMIKSENIKIIKSNSK